MATTNPTPYEQAQATFRQANAEHHAAIQLVHDLRVLADGDPGLLWSPEFRSAQNRRAETQQRMLEALKEMAMAMANLTPEEAERVRQCAKRDAEAYHAERRSRLGLTETLEGLRARLGIEQSE